MGNGLKYEVVIETSTSEERFKIGSHIHDQLVGNQDYIDCNIVLNIDDPHKVVLQVYKDCKYVPPITIYD